MRLASYNVESGLAASWSPPRWARMKYRPEIDGLRTLAVLPVIFSHASIKGFSGGFVGVDIFFVISGYLITSLILSDLANGQFSIRHFYMRRIRRIIPALYTVMLTSTVFAYFWMMPDEFKRFGQSIVATTLFSNNMLLAVTSGYWDLASEFKPLLHTWSLGVEEQFYLVFPFLLILFFRIRNRGLKATIGALLTLSFAGANLWILKDPSTAFYVLPTRAWELFAGALAGISLAERGAPSRNFVINQCMSLAGVLLIAFSVVSFDQQNLSPGASSAIPVLGTLFVILFAQRDTLACRVLSSKPMVGIGLISYSLYLWHQPLLALLRIYSQERPSAVEIYGVILLTFLLSFISWKFIERPFRNPQLTSQKLVLAFVAVTSASLLVVGVFLDRSYGLPSRIYDASIRVDEMDKRIYNERAFQFKKDGFSVDNSPKSRILIIGNSFGRDFVNMTIENFNLEHAQIIYRDDLHECIEPFDSELSRRLFSEANVIVFASGDYNLQCIKQDIEFAQRNKSEILYIGTKNFGYNLNWLIQLDQADRANRLNSIPEDTLLLEDTLSSSIPQENYISLLSAVEREGKIPITDEFGRLLSTDRVHLTKYGAIYFGQRALLPSRYSKSF